MRFGNRRPFYGGEDVNYRSTKATLNAAMKSLSIEPRDRGVGVLIMHLGRVRTDMGGLDAQLSPEKSITSLRRVIESASRVKSARLFDFEGKEMPW
ncbi:MAG: hypothetical protein ACKPIG_17950 [Microcystis panniformis]